MPRKPRFYSQYIYIRHIFCRLYWPQHRCLSGGMERVAGFRFHKSLQLLPGVRLNIGKKGTSLSLGPKGAHITTGSTGTYFSLDLPGSGASYRKKLDSKTTQPKSDNKQSEAAAAEN